MYLIQIQTPSNTCEFVVNQVSTAIAEFDKTDSPKVLVVKSIDLLEDETN